MKTGLALSSGGARGLAHISAIQTLIDAGYSFSCIAGTSMGAVVAAIYCEGKLEDLKELTLGLEKKKLLKLADLVLPRQGIISGKKLMQELAKLVPTDRKIEDYKIPLTIVAADYATGSEVVFRKGKVHDAIRSSISIPGVFVPWQKSRKLFVDGAIVNPLPLKQLKEMGARRMVAVNVNCMPKKALMSDLTLGETIWKKREKEPSIVDILVQSVQVMELHLSRHIIRRYKPDLLIEPQLMDMAFLDFTQPKKALRAGRLAALRALRGPRRS